MIDLSSLARLAAEHPEALAHPVAPVRISGVVRDFVREWTVTLKPRANRWPHMLNPMTPVPIQPSRVLPGATSRANIAAVPFDANRNQDVEVFRSERSRSERKWVW